MTKAEKKVIIETYDDCLKAIEEYKLSEEGADLINQGWIEALEFVLRLEEQLKPKTGYTRAKAKFRKD